MQIREASGCAGVVVKKFTVVGYDFFFTPNGDGLNDFFSPVLKPESYTSYNMKIYNKWYHLIYNKDNTPWDGKVNGVLLGEGPFSYFITVSFKAQSPFIFTGLINIIR